MPPRQRVLARAAVGCMLSDGDFHVRRLRIDRANGECGHVRRMSAETILGRVEPEEGGPWHVATHEAAHHSSWAWRGRATCSSSSNEVSAGITISTV